MSLALWDLGKYKYKHLLSSPALNETIELCARPQPGLERRRWLMCRNIKMLFNFNPPVTDEEIRAASLQFVRKLSGFNKPSKANEAAFNAAIDEIAAASGRLLSKLETNAPPRSREEEAARAKARNAARFGDESRAR
jgi:hypothetical protein